MHLDLFRDQSKVFPEVHSKADVNSICIWNCKYKSLKVLEEFKNLEEIVVVSFPDSYFDCFSMLHKLNYVSILDMPKISNLDALSELINVKSLSLATSPSWDSSGKCTVVSSLEPIVKLKKLKHLELFGVVPQDKTLDVLDKCENLQTARFSQYPKKEIEKFYSNNKNISNSFNPKPSFPM